MKIKDKNNKAGIPDLFHYSGGKMTERERNAFERELQKDPFLEEASEGFSEFPPDALAGDMIRLERKLKARVSHRYKFTYYRIAASIAVLMILSSVYIIIRQTGPANEMGELSTTPVTIDIQEAEAINEPDVQEYVDDITLIEKNVEPEAVSKNTDIFAGKKEPDEKVEPPETQKADEISGTGLKDADLYNNREKLAAPAAAKAESIKEEESLRTGYTPPHPADGQDNFNRYIEENIKNPELLIAGQRAVVVINFIVRSSGKIDSINVIRSPGEDYSREAVRLVKEGPSWKPAESNGEKKDGEVRMKIVFK